MGILNAFKYKRVKDLQPGDVVLIADVDDIVIDEAEIELIPWVRATVTATEPAGLVVRYTEGEATYIYTTAADHSGFIMSSEDDIRIPDPEPSV